MIKTINYKPSHFKQIATLWKNLGLDDRKRCDNAITIEKTIKSGGKFLVLIDNETDEIIGTSWLTNDARRIYLHHFGIKEEYQNKGYGKILLKDSIDFAKKNNLQIKLEVHRENLKAINFYKKFGFKDLGDYLVFIIRKF